MRSVKERAVIIWGDPHSVANYYVLLCRHPSLQIPTGGLKPSLPASGRAVMEMGRF